MSDYLQQLHSDILTTALQFGMADADARGFAQAMVDRIQTNYAGPAYIPQPNKSQRNERIRSMFNGVNHDVVCAAFDISKSTLYRIIK